MVVASDARPRICYAIPAAKFMQAAAARLGWSARSFHRVLRVARTIADPAGDETIQASHLAEAIQYRRVLAVQ